MKYPMQLENIEHKSGGKITRVTGFEHVIDKPRDGHSTDTWHFIGDVDWSDGDKSIGIELGPQVLCCDDPTHNPELTALYAAMNEHLAEHGEWSDDPKHEGWYAHKRS